MSEAAVATAILLTFSFVWADTRGWDPMRLANPKLASLVGLLVVAAALSLGVSATAQEIGSGPPAASGVPAVPTFPPELQPAGSVGDLRRFTALRQQCERQYPSVVRLVYTEVANATKQGKRRFPLVLGAHPGVVFAGQAGSPPKYFLDLGAIRKAAEDPVAGRAPKPPWATTQCMIVIHELWEYGVGSHAAGVGLENVMRTLNKQPRRTRQCGPIHLPSPPGGEAYFVHLWHHTEVLWLTDRSQLSRISHEPIAGLKANSIFRCPPS